MKLQNRVRALVSELAGDRLAKGLFRIASGSFLVKVAGAGLGFGTEVLLARLLSVNEYGVYVYVWTWLSVLALPCTVGFKGSLVRFVSQFRSEQRWDKLKGVLRWSTQLSLGVSFVVGGTLSAVLFLYFDGRPSGIAEGMAVGMLALPVLSLNLIQKGALQGLKKVIRADVPYLVLRRVLLAAVALAIYWKWGQLNAVDLLVGVAFTLLITFVLASYWLWTSLPIEVRETAPEYRKKHWIQVSFPFLLISGAAIIQGKTDIIMLGSLGTAGAAGIYGAATRITMLISFGLNATNMIVAPSISEYYNTGQTEKLQRLIAFASSGVFLFTILISAGLIVFGDLLLLLFGGEFTVGYAALVILVVGKTANALLGPVGYLMTMTGRQWLASKVFAVGAVLNIILNAVLIPPFGVVGAACATATSITGWNVFLAYYAWKDMGVNPTAGAILDSKYWRINDE